eukprot:CAMPEP_0179171342 /NCGR_PEP_ID=MMETSP0796-20121207/84458_1 /TAXON_ID=73915 /ORGANISM="Pyrodinium bahamense, Strain pbaha01" /LENGTH=55 /DNA_ID=CAMNT_0020874405 /DNA_START=145 /DNA_END=312 /DNA_ORIENTATION=+
MAPTSTKPLYNAMVWKPRLRTKGSEMLRFSMSSAIKQNRYLVNAAACVSKVPSSM